MIKINLVDFLSLNPELLKGKTICFGTDTVYGIGVMLGDKIEEGLSKIYEMKKRDLSKPLAILAPNADLFLDKVTIMNSKTEELIKLWPGALTLIFKKKDSYFDQVTELKTIGFRIPNCPVALTVLNHLGLMATTSVNLSGQEPINDIKKIEKKFSKFIDYLIIDPVVTSNVSSTVIDVSDAEIKVIRKGDLLV